MLYPRNRKKKKSLFRQPGFLAGFICALLACLILWKYRPDLPQEQTAENQLPAAKSAAPEGQLPQLKAQGNLDGAVDRPLSALPSNQASEAGAGSEFSSLPTGNGGGESGKIEALPGGSSSASDLVSEKSLPETGFVDGPKVKLPSLNDFQLNKVDNYEESTSPQDQIRSDTEAGRTQALSKRDPRFDRIRQNQNPYFFFEYRYLPKPLSTLQLQQYEKLITQQTAKLAANPHNSEAGLESWLRFQHKDLQYVDKFGSRDEYLQRKLALLNERLLYLNRFGQRMSDELTGVYYDQRGGFLFVSEHSRRKISFRFEVFRDSSFQHKRILRDTAVKAGGSTVYISTEQNLSASNGEGTIVELSHNPGKTAIAVRSTGGITSNQPISTDLAGRYLKIYNSEDQYSHDLIYYDIIPTLPPAGQYSPRTETALALDYFFGNSLVRDQKKLRYWLDSAVHKNEAAAHFGLYLVNNYGVQQAANKQLAAKHLLQAENTMPEAAIALALEQIKGEIIDPKPAQAAQQLEELANPRADVLLAKYLLVNKPDRTTEALDYLKAAAGAGEAEAFGQLGLYYLRETDKPELARKYYTAGFKLADPESSILYALDQMTNQRNYKEGLMILQELADLFYPAAAFHYAEMILKQKSADLDAAELQDVLYYLSIAEDHGHVNASYLLGLLHESKRLAANYRVAAQYYQRAVNAGHAKARKRLARLYSEGLGVTRDKVRAKMLSGS